MPNSIFVKLYGILILASFTKHILQTRTGLFRPIFGSGVVAEEHTPQKTIPHPRQ